MARRSRRDVAGSWHHVMNRGVARRSMFENDADVRSFLAGVARAVRRGQLEVHAWCVMTTHFHMLVRSPAGELSDAMRRIQNVYVRGFNQGRRRDGSLVRGRFCSRRVGSLAYRKVLVRYIDGNPVAARLCADARSYRWCSARQYATGSGPRWLTRDWVEEMVAEQAGSSSFAPGMYPRSAGPDVREMVADFVERRLASRGGVDELDSLLAMAAPAVLRWLRRKALLADGALSPQPCVPERSLWEVIDGMAAVRGAWHVRRDSRATDGWGVLRAGLLRDVAGASLVRIAHRLAVSPVHAKRLCERHRALLADDAGYAEVTAQCFHSALQRSFGAL